MRFISFTICFGDGKAWLLQALEPQSDPGQAAVQLLKDGFLVGVFEKKGAKSPLVRSLTF